MIAVSQWQPAILEGELPGDIPEARASACALVALGMRPPPLPLFGAGQGPLAEPQRLRFVNALLRSQNRSIPRSGSADYGSATGLRQKWRSRRVLSGRGVHSTATR